MDKEHDQLKTFTIRLEACSFSTDNDSTDLLSTIGNKSAGGTALQGVVGKAVTNVRAEPGSLAENIEVGERFCSLAPIPFSIGGTVPNEVIIKPYDSLKIPDGMDAVDCAASLPSCVRIYTAIHMLARLRQGERVLIACPNDLNFTCLAIQICKAMGLPNFTLVADDVGLSAVKERTSSTSSFRLYDADADALSRACNKACANVGFACILDFKNRDNTIFLPITFSNLVRLLGTFGRIVTDRKGKQIPISDLDVLYLKSGSLHYLFDPVWHLSPLFYGKYKHILKAIVDQLMDGTLRPVIGLEVNPMNMEEAMAKHDGKVGCTVFKF